MKKPCSISFLIFWLFLISLGMTGCGGGGGGSGSEADGPAPMVYSGVTSQAAITPANAEVIATEALLGASAGSGLTLASSLQVESRPASIRLFVVELPKVLRQSAKSADGRAEGTRSVQRTESKTIPGTCGGSLRYALTVNDSTGDFAGTFVFSQYCDSGITITGSVDVDGSLEPTTGVFDMINFNFDNLTSDDFVMSGAISVDEEGPSSFIAMGFLAEDTVSDKVYWVRDYAMVVTEIDTADVHVSLTGVFYHPDYGYVNVSTPDPFIFTSTDEWPSSGTMRCEGSGNTTASLTAVDNRSYRIETDTNGDAAGDYFSEIRLWADL